MEKLSELDLLHQKMKNCFLHLSIIETNKFLDEINNKPNKLENKWIEQLETISSLMGTEAFILQSLNFSPFKLRNMLENIQSKYDLSFENIICNIENMPYLRKYFLFLNQYRNQLRIDLRRRERNQYFQIIVFYQMLNCLLQKSTNKIHLYAKFNHLKNLIFYSCPGVDPELELIEYEQEAIDSLGLPLEEYQTFKRKILTESFCNLLMTYEQMTYEEFMSELSQVSKFLIWSVYTELLEGNIHDEVIKIISDEQKIKILLNGNEQYRRKMALKV